MKFVLSPTCQCIGAKYLQSSHRDHSPSHVAQQFDSHPIGCRMEDCAFVSRLTINETTRQVRVLEGSRSHVPPKNNDLVYPSTPLTNTTVASQFDSAGITNQVLVMSVNDGHGSIKTNPHYFVGGYESARFVSDQIERHFQRSEVLWAIVQTARQIAHSSHWLSSGIRAEDRMETLVAQLFDHIQNKWLSEALKGGDHSMSVHQRVNDLCSNAIDGEYFSRIYDPTFTHSWQDMERQQEQYLLQFEPHDRPQITIDKQTVPYVLSTESSLTESLPVTAAYITQSGRRVLPDFGCTSSLVIMSEGLLFVANVGDSDVYRVPVAGNHERLTDNHHNTNPVETLRMNQAGTQVENSYFVVSAHGHKRFIQPSRSIGHQVFRFHGITHRPSFVMKQVRPGDLILVGSDGLWNGCPLSVIVSIRKTLQQEEGSDILHTTKGLERLNQLILKFIHKRYAAHRHDNIVYASAFVL